jgi:hypothetical protein
MPSKLPADKKRTHRNIMMRPEESGTPAYLRFLGNGSLSLGIDRAVDAAIANNTQPPVADAKYPNPFPGEKND